ncbi:MAG: hypothetical protein AAF488_12880 [Planctomycetota bacterium]
MSLPLVTGEVRAQGAGATSQDPTPYRADDGQIFGRDFNYTDDSFLVRGLYRFHPESEEEWALDREGLRAFAGSVSSDEFYTFQQVRGRYDVDAPLFFEFRYLRDEDFDSRYSSALFGVGADIGRGWSAALLAEVLPEKSGIDVQPEIRWTDGTGNEFRAAAIAVDAVFDDKSDEGEYTQRAWTFFAEGSRRLGERCRLTTWVNWNPQSERRFDADAFHHNYRSLRGGARFTWAWNADWVAVASGQGELTQSSLRYIDTTDTRDRRLSRRHFRTEIELRRKLDDVFTVWAGARYFRLSEKDRRPRDVVLDGTIHRSETTVFAGVDWRLHPRVLFWPGVYVDAISNREDFPNSPGRDDTDRGYLTAISFPFLVDIGKGAHLSAQASVLAHALEFGGGSIHLSIPF